MPLGFLYTLRYAGMLGLGLEANFFGLGLGLEGCGIGFDLSLELCGLGLALLALMASAL